MVIMEFVTNNFFFFFGSVNHLPPLLIDANSNLLDIIAGSRSFHFQLLKLSYLRNYAIYFVKTVYIKQVLISVIKIVFVSVGLCWT